MRRHLRPRLHPSDLLESSTLSSPASCQSAADAWITHNIEEVGHLDHIVPAIYPAESRNV